MARRTHEELKEALAVFDMSIENPPSKAELIRRWKELLSKVHSDKPGGSEFLSKQLNVARDVIKEWLDAGKPTWPGAKESAAERARERARREREAEATRARNKAESESAAKGGSKAGAADEDQDQSQEYAQENWEKHFRPAEAGGDFGVYDRRRRRRGLNKLWLIWGSVAAVVVGLYIGVSSDGGSYWPYIGVQPQNLIVCWDKIAIENEGIAEFSTNEANKKIGDFLLWHGIWWGGHPVLYIKAKRVDKPKPHTQISVIYKFFKTQDDMYSKSGCFVQWRKAEVINLDDLR